MATVTVTPLVLKNTRVNIKNGATDVGDFEQAVSQVEFIPANSAITWKGLSPDAVFNFPGATTWTCTLAFAQDWTKTTSLSRYLFDNDGAQVTMTFTPNNGAAVSSTNPAVRATVTLQAGAIGGSIDSVAVGSVTLQVSGKPQFLNTLS